MRYRPDYKAEIHQKILHDASRRFRSEGLSGAAVATVMNDSGLTHGGFYKHFESKDDLFIAALRQAFEEISDRLSDAAEKSRPGTAWKTIVKTYLSPEHCDHSACGCPLAALATELGRADQTMKAKILGELTKYKARILPFMPGRSTADKESAFLAIYSTMVGAIAIARILPTPAAREKVLATARDFLLRSF
jgi:TetR/AcrR family transcriptional repressor of nem operon